MGIWIQTRVTELIILLSVLFTLNRCVSGIPAPTLSASKTLPSAESTTLAPASTPSPLLSATTAPISPSPTTNQLVATLDAIIRAYTATPPPTRVPTPLPVRWDVYDRDPQHPWNRLFRALYERTTADGHEYGRDTLDPLLWLGLPNLVYGPPYQHAVQVLDEFSAARSDTITTDPLKRALLQRDLWAVFDMMAWEWNGYESERRELETRLAPLIQRLALTKGDIESLPDNYQAAVHTQAFAANYQPGSASRDFLPDQILAPGNDWIPVGRGGGPVAMAHVEQAPFLGRSAFLLFMRVPGGREAALSFLDQLLTGQASVPEGTEVALVRRMLLIDTQGNLVPTPIVESIQLRHFVSSSAQFYFEFTLDRNRLFAAQTGGLKPLKPEDRENPVFRFNGLDFSLVDSEQVYREQVVILSACALCHEDRPQGIAGANTILSYSRARFPLPEGPARPTLSETTAAQETQATIAWKLEQLSWKMLKGLWRK